MSHNTQLIDNIVYKTRSSTLLLFSVHVPVETIWKHTYALKSMPNSIHVFCILNTMSRLTPYSNNYCLVSPFSAYFKLNLIFTRKKFWTSHTSFTFSLMIINHLQCTNNSITTDKSDKEEITYIQLYAEFWTCFGVLGTVQ